VSNGIPFHALSPFLIKTSGALAGATTASRRPFRPMASVWTAPTKASCNCSLAPEAR
jgi:hypothetical protein